MKRPAGPGEALRFPRGSDARASEDAWGALPLVLREPPRVRLVDQDARGATYEMTVAWEGALAERVARTDGSAAMLLAQAAGGWQDATAAVALPTDEVPRVEVLAADYDELPLRTAPSDDAAGVLGRPLAAVHSVGMERRQPTGTLAVGVLRYDAAAQVLRRYRRVTVRVTYPAPFAEAPRAAAPRALARAGASAHVRVERSVLADGAWYKLRVRREGVYRVDADYLRGLGLDPAQVRVDRLQVYGNGGAPLPALNGAPRPADLVQNAAWTEGGPTFADGGALYFFAEGPTGWRYDADGADWAHYVNPFTTTVAYFLHVGAEPGDRLRPGAFPNFADAARQTEFVDRLFVEEDRFMAESSGGGSGLDWLGQEVTSALPARTVLDTTLAGQAAGTVRYEAVTATRANPSVEVQFAIGGETVASRRPPSTNLSTPVGNWASTTRFDFERQGEAGLPLSVEMRVVGARNNATVYLNWLRAFVPRRLQAQDGYLRFHTPGGASGRFEFVLEGFAGTPQVWDVTEPGALRALAAQASGGGVVVQVEVAEGAAPRELVAFVPSSARVAAPPAGAAVPNQNLHGLAGFPDFVIVTHPDFRPAAEALADHRRAQDGLDPLVVDIDAIYNEFSGGHVDMRAVRDYLKFLYDRAGTEDQLPDYLLLFGDGHYDFRGIQAARREDGSVANNFVPVFESEETLLLQNSYTSDDYFGLLDDDEGVWPFLGSGSPSAERVDLGIGRFPVRTLAEAEAMVAKVRRYEDPATFGAWRARYTLLSDDNNPDEGDRDLHLQNIDAIATNAVVPVADYLNLRKIYTLAYRPEITAVGRRYPQARADAIRALEEGTLVWNYAGHGGIEKLADENLLDIEAIEALDNAGRPTICVTATCSFGRMDMIVEQSAAEQMFLKPEGGGIAMLTTMRVVFTSTSLESYNTALNLQLNEALLTRDDDGRPRRLGDVMRVTKNTSAGAQGNNRKFALLGDPTLRVGLPTQPVRVTAVNGQPIAGDGAPTRLRTPVLQALERAEIEGEVLRLDGQRDTGFNGEVEVAVFDAARQVAIPEDVALFQPGGVFEARSDLLFRGRASASQGAFRLAFVVPQDLSYSGEAGRIAVYARSATADATGATEEVVIGTTAGNATTDARGPAIALSFAAEDGGAGLEGGGAPTAAFVDGGLVGPSPVLVVRLEDETGINTVGSGVGHELLLTLDGDAASAVDIGRFYEGDLDDPGAGTIRFALPEQADGPHTLTVRAWDVANNSAEATLSYVVASDEDLVLRNVLNYPNPTPGPTDFVFEHNQPPGTPARVQIRVYTLAGRPVLTLDDAQTLPSGALDGHLVRVRWDGRDEDFDRLASGVYLYRVRVEVERAEGERQVAERVERLAIIR